MSVCPQVCSTAIRPILAPRRRAASVMSASAAARISRRIDRLLVLEGDLGRRRRQGEDDMEIGNGQQLGLSRRQPLRSRRALTFWTMAVAAGIVGDAGEAAIVAALDMTAERGRAAGRDRADHAPFDAPEMSGVRLFVSSRRGGGRRRPVRTPAAPSPPIRAASRSARAGRADWPWRR